MHNTNMYTASKDFVSFSLYRTEVITITLKNPLEEPVQFSCDNSNTRHFVVTGLPEGQVNH